MRIVLTDLNSHGMADMRDWTVFMSARLGLDRLVGVLRHELAHLVSGDVTHGPAWRRACRALGGVQEYAGLDVGNISVVHNISFNVGNVTGIQYILTDFHLLQHYRKFSQRILGTEGQWEVKGDNKIRLFPTPRGSFPVVIEYIPTVQRFRSPSAREILKRALVAEAKIMLGNIRSKYGNIPAPDGGNLSLNGDALRTEGQTEKEKAAQDAILLGEPLGVHLW